MDQKVKRLLENKGNNYIFPFFWQHGESEEVLREYMKVTSAPYVWKAVRTRIFWEKNGGRIWI